MSLVISHAESNREVLIHGMECCCVSDDADSEEGQMKICNVPLTLDIINMTFSDEKPEKLYVIILTSLFKYK